MLRITWLNTSPLNGSLPALGNGTKLVREVSPAVVATVRHGNCSAPDR